MNLRVFVVALVGISPMVALESAWRICGAFSNRSRGFHGVRYGTIFPGARRDRAGNGAAGIRPSEKANVGFQPLEANNRKWVPELHFARVSATREKSARSQKDGWQS